MKTKKIIEAMNLNKALNITSDNYISGTQDEISELCHNAVFLDGSSTYILSTLTTQSYDVNTLQAFIVNRDGTIDNFCFCMIPEEMREATGMDTNVHLITSTINEFCEKYQESPFQNSPYILAYETKKGIYRFLPAGKM